MNIHSIPLLCPAQRFSPGDAPPATDRRDHRRCCRAGSIAAAGIAGAVIYGVFKVATREIKADPEPLVVDSEEELSRCRAARRAAARLAEEPSGASAALAGAERAPRAARAWQDSAGALQRQH